jgi:hypothetical protein
MSRQLTGWIAALAVLAVSSDAMAAQPERPPLQAELSVKAEAVSGSLSNDRRMVIGRCADCEQLRLQLGSATRYFVNGQTTSWSELSAYLRANPGAALQVSYQVRNLTATRLAASGQ